MRNLVSGKLRHLITFLKPTAGVSDGVFGDRQPTFAAWKSVWASIEPISARELEYALSFANTVSHKIRMRYFAGVLPTMRVQYRGRTFAIDGITNTEERSRELVLMCSEQVAGPS